MTYDGITYITGSSICTCFSEYFESVFRDPATSYDINSLNLPSPNHLHVVNKITVVENDILSLLQNIDITKPTGSDGISPLYILGVKVTRVRRYYPRYPTRDPWVVLNE